MSSPRRVDMISHAARYPRVEAYAATLPESWSSYPACAISGAILQHLRESGTFDDLPALPPEIGMHVTGAPTRAWVPEVVGVGAFLAVSDARFGGPSGDLDFLAWMASLNALLLGPVLPRVAVPAGALEWIPGGWAQFHRGTSLSVVASDSRSAEIAFAHPPRIFPTPWVEIRRRTICAVLARSGAAQPTIRATSLEDGSTRFHASWK